MIEGFFNIIKQDVAFLNDYYNEGHSGQTEDKKVNCVAMRMFAAFGMAVSVIAGIRSFAATNPAGAILQLALAVASYAFCHDVFVIAENQEKGLIDQIGAAGKGIVDDIADLWKGRKNFDDVPRHPLADGTLYRPLWDHLFAMRDS